MYNTICNLNRELSCSADLELLNLFTAKNCDKTYRSKAIFRKVITCDTLWHLGLIPPVPMAIVRSWLEFCER